MNGKKESPLKSSEVVWALGLLSAVLLLIFWRSCLPGVVHFSNDGPLGVQNADWLKLPAAFSGIWVDLNSLGVNGGSWPADLNTLLRWILGPIAYSKYFGAICILILGLSSAWFFKTLKLSPVAIIVGSLAVALNSTFFSTSCWGLSGQLLAFSMDFVAMGLIASMESATPSLQRWARLLLAGLAVGMNVMEAADIGAIFSVVVAMFIFYKSVFTEEGSTLAKIGRGFGRTVIVAVMAGFLATQIVVSLVGTQIQGIAGTAQDESTKAERWQWATQWSLPKKETLGLLVPGLFGYRMDTPQGLPASMEKAYEGGNYWGGVGRDPAWDSYLDGPKQGSPPIGVMRFSGTGYYAGVLVLLIAAWSVVQASRKMGSPYAVNERRLICFWGILAIGALLLAWGRFAPFYSLVYQLPYFSTIRNPTKYLFVFSMAVTVLFAYGVHGLWKMHVLKAGQGSTRSSGGIGRWWSSLRGPDRAWAWGCVAFVVVCAGAGFLYTVSRAGLEQHLAAVQLGGATGKMIAAFSIKQVWIFMVILVIAVALLFAFLSGTFTGQRAKVGAMLLGAFVVIDLGRAGLPFVIHWDYEQKYDLSVKNPVIELLKQAPYEQRVAQLPFPPVDSLPPELARQVGLMQQVYRIEWAQHHFPYHNIQSLDIVQMPRMPEDLKSFEEAWRAHGVTGLLREWELTSTRYLLGPAPVVEVLNDQLDAANKRFAVKLPFAIGLKPGFTEARQLEQLTATATPNGPCAVIEFKGALPRAGLYSEWIVSTNNTQTLAKLFDAKFNPRSAVIVSENIGAPAATNASPGKVEFVTYKPTHITLKTEAAAPSVLLLNDRHDANWKVFVDGKEQPLLRCNYLMRGVQVPPGAHTVEFRFKVSTRPLMVTLSAIGLGVLLTAFLALNRQKPEAERSSGQESVN